LQESRRSHARDLLDQIDLGGSKRATAVRLRRAPRPRPDTSAGAQRPRRSLRSLERRTGSALTRAGRIAAWARPPAPCSRAPYAHLSTRAVDDRCVTQFEPRSHAGRIDPALETNEDSEIVETPRRPSCVSGVARALKQIGGVGADLRSARHDAGGATGSVGDDGSSNRSSRDAVEHLEALARAGATGADARPAPGGTNACG
jgi:hypothetical protein